MNSLQNNHDYQIPSRLSRLLEVMDVEGITMYMIPDSDPHNSEYIGDHFKCREYLSGFTGSNGMLMVSHEESGLWTDGRYFIQAENELAGSGITLFKMGEKGVPTIKEYLKTHLHEGDVFGVDGRLINARDGIEYRDIAAGCGASMRADVDLAGRVWDDRPAMSAEPVYVIGDDISGESTADKIGRVRESMKKQGADAYVLSRLDDIMWLMNIRGNDVACTPVALSYVYMTEDETRLFIQDKALDDSVRAHLERNGVKISPYADFIPALESAQLSGAMMYDPDGTNHSIYECLSGKAADPSKLIGVPNPTEEMEAVRNDVQLEHIRDVYIRDSAVLARFICFIQNEIAAGHKWNEYEAAMKLDSMRADIPGFIELSFDTISAYGPNAAMMHYEATADDHADIEPKGMYLVDSGGQYMGGTTDVTRTVAVGAVTDDMKRDFTQVCVGMLRLADAVFIEGCTGRNLDILARGELWKRGVDYKCGTGHGVGFMLGVHTGPQNIRHRFTAGRREAPLRAGMTVSDEPGVYIEGRYGIRTENILEVVDRYDNGDGHFLGFEHLTWVPIDPKLIDTQYMERNDIRLLNEYHRGVYERLIPYMETEEEKDWLRRVTSPLNG